MIRRFAICSLLAVAVAALIAGSDHTSSASAAQKKKFASIEAIAASHGITADTPGVAVCVVSPKGPPLIFVMGKADLKEKHDIKPSTLFELASCSKPFTAMGILILHDQGKLNVEDPVRKYLPELPIYHKGNPVKIKHLLQHTGGLPDYFDLDEPTPKGRKFLVNEDYVPEFANQKAKHPALFAPGEKYDYSNTGFALLAVIAARTSKQPFGEFMRDSIFAPLKMNHTFILENPQAPKLAMEPAPKALAYSFDKKKQAWIESWGCPPRRHETNLVVGDGGVWTSLDDMQKWDKAVRERGLIKEATWAMALSPSLTADKKTNDYGFGWGLGLDDKKKVTSIGHEGSWGGFETMYDLDLTKNRSIIVLSNREKFDPGKFGRQVNTFVDGN